MYQKSKKSVVKILSLAFTAALALSCATLMPKTYNAKAETAAPQNLTADALGILRWDEVTGATGYEWSYSSDGSRYTSGGTVDGAEADISAAIYEAVKAEQTDGDEDTKATLKLKVKSLPSGGETSIDFASNTMDIKYRNSIFDKYINYGYSSHDISERYAPAATESGVTGVNTFTANSAVSMNELLTFSLSFSAEGAYYRTGFLSGGGTAWGDFYYGLTINQTGKISTIRQNVSKSNWGHDFPEMPVGETSYFAIGAFDTYSVTDNTWIGETLYLRRTDIVDGKPVVVGTLSVFYDARLTGDSSYNFCLPSDRPEHLPNAKNHTATCDRTSEVTLEDGTTSRAGTREKSTFYMYTGDAGSVLKSGKIPTSVATPSIAYYDNVTGRVQWNRVDGATGYEWSYAGKDGWIATEDEFIPAEKVSTAIASAEAKDFDNVRFAVRAVKGNGKSEISYVGLDLTAFYGSRTALKDISDIHETFKDPSAVMNETTLNSNNGYAVNTFVENAFTVSETTNWMRRFTVSMFATGHGQSNGYDVSVHAQGYVTISSGRQWQVNQTNLYWQVVRAPAFEIGKKYIATYGVEELFNLNDEKVADRITIRISEEEADGYRKLLTIVSYDNYEYNWEGVARKTLNSEGTYSSKQINYYIDYDMFCDISCANSDFEYKVTPVVNGKALTDYAQTVKYRQAYDFTDLLEIEGYDWANAEWKYKLTANGEEKPFELKGDYWTITFNEEGIYEGAFYTQADLVDYTINYELGSLAGVTNTKNPSTYTVEDEITLQSPQVPQGYVFKGWYESFEGGVYSDKVETVSGTGEVTLYARIVRGYGVDVTVDGQEPVRYVVEEGESFTLPQPANVYGKEFIGWYVKNGNEFVSYTGETTFEPASDMEFWAKYAYATYTVTYNAFDGTHSNPTTYTVENVVTFSPAEKANYFFDGWYENADFSGSPVTDTDGLTKDLTLYAKYIEDEVSRTVTYSLSDKMQRLPIPKLPYGATYSAKLYEEGKTEELDIIEGNAYVFDKECKYTLKYFITLATGDEIERQIVINVATAKITVDGTYKAEYEVGEELVILDAYLPDGSKAEVEVKKDGKKVELNGNTLVLEAGSYEITYKDGTGVLPSVAVSFEVVETVAWYDGIVNTAKGVFGGCNGSIGSGVSAMLAALSVAGVAIFKKKED